MVRRCANTPDPDNPKNSNDYVFSIPLYQRPDAWEREQAEELLDDLLGFIVERRLSNPDASEPLFTQDADCEPNARTRDELEGRAEANYEPSETVVNTVQRAA